MGLGEAQSEANLLHTLGFRIKNHHSGKSWEKLALLEKFRRVGKKETGTLRSNYDRQP